MPPPAVSPDPVFDVAILGGGAAGLLVAIHLLHASPRPLRVAIIEPRPMLGQGAAYSTDYPEHLLNVIAARMSVFGDDPGHFVRYLTAHGADPGIASTFVPRREFGSYLRETLDAQARSDGLQRFEDEAVDVVPGLAGSPFEVRLRSGGFLAASSLVLAVGNSARPLPVPAALISGLPHVIEAWNYDRIRSITPDANVCILGAGLSMVDAVVSLAAGGHRGKITVVSRHGLRPLPHARPGEQTGSVDDLLALGLSARMRAIRARAAASIAAGEPWQWTMDRLRHHGQSLWATLSDVEQRRYLRHAARVWDIHRHRIAPSADACLTGLIASGRLQIAAGRVSSISGGARTVVVRPRGASIDREFPADVVINGTGVETRVDRMRNPLMASLVERGLVRPGKHGIGIDTDAGGAVIGRDGSVQANFLALGAMRIGALLESIAIPELRGQAQRVTERLLATTLESGHHR